MTTLIFHGVVIVIVFQVLIERLEPAHVSLSTCGHLAPLVALRRQHTQSCRKNTAALLSVDRA